MTTNIMAKWKLTKDSQYHGQRETEMTDNIMAKGKLIDNIMAKGKLTKDRQYHGQRETANDRQYHGQN